MSEELKNAFETMAMRGQPAGGAAVVQWAFELSIPARSDKQGRRLLLFMSAAAVAVTVALVVGAVYVRSQVDNLKRIDVAAALDGTDDGSQRQMTVMLVGTDEVNRDGVEFSRTDAIMLVRLDRDAQTASVLSVPRDLYVSSGRAGERDRINTLFGPDPKRLIRAVQDATGVAVDHYVQINFDGLARAVEAVGGIKLLSPTALRDQLSGLDLPAGCNQLDGDRVLAYVRSRHLESAGTDGAYHVDPTGDLGRIARQQELFLSAIHQVRDKLFGSVLTLQRVIDAVRDSVTSDTNFSVADMTRFAQAFTAPAAPNVELLVVPTIPMALSNGAAVLDLDRAGMPAVLDAFNDATVPTQSSEQSSQAQIDC